MSSSGDDLFIKNYTMKRDFLQNLWLEIKKITEICIDFLDFFSFLNLLYIDWTTRLFAYLIWFVNLICYVGNWGLRAFEQKFSLSLIQVNRLKETFFDEVSSTWHTVIDEVQQLFLLFFVFTFGVFTLVYLKEIKVFLR